MKKYILIVISVLFLMSCEPSTSEDKGFVLPEALSHCKTYFMTDGRGRGITVIHCPNSTTTTQSGGKHKTSTTVIDQGVML